MTLALTAHIMLISSLTIASKTTNAVSRCTISNLLWLARTALLLEGIALLLEGTDRTVSRFTLFDHLVKERLPGL